MNTIDFEALSNAIQEQLDDRVMGKYDLDTILRSAMVCWDGIGVMVKSSDFVMVFDIISYEVLDYTGNDLR